MTLRHVPLDTARAALALAAALAVACAAAPTSEKSRPAARAGRDAAPPPPVLPREEFIVGEGSGATREGAVAAARASGLASVKSQVTSSFLAVSGEWKVGSRVEVEQRVLSEVTSRVESTYGAFFEEVSAARSGTSWSAIVAARRSRLDQALVADAERTFLALDLAWRRVEATSDWLAAAPAWCEARRMEREADGLDLQRMAVTGRRTWNPERVERRRRVHETLHMAKSGALLLVGQPTAPLASDGQPALRDLPDGSTELVTALRAAGWVAEVGAPSCGAGVTLVLASSVAADCLHSKMGVEQCSAWVSWEARRCGVERTLFLVASEKSVAWNSTDRDAALRKALRALPAKASAEDARDRVLALLGDRCPEVTGVTDGPAASR